MSVKPPATSTLPFCSSVAVAYCRTAVGLPVADHVPVAGSYSSAVPSPAISTFPFCNEVKVAPKRTVGRTRRHISAAAQQRLCGRHR